MLPHTRALYEALRSENDAPELAPRGDTARFAPEEVLQLKLKRKHAQAMLKRMMVEAGYGDLARMTSFTREPVEDYIDE